MFTTIFYQPIYNLLVVLYRAFDSNLGLAIIAIALVSRLVTLPLTIRQIKMTEKNKEMMEKMNKAKEKYKNDKERQQKELMKIQSEYLPSQLAGCLPLILQLIFLIYIYKVIRNLISGASGFNAVAYSFISKFPDGYTINHSFLGGILNLNESPSAIGTSDIVRFLPYIVLILLVGLSQYISIKMLNNKNKKKDDKGQSEKPKKNSDKPDDFGEIMQQSTQQAMMLMPIMLTFGAYSFPAGLSLYWVSQSIFQIIQQVVIMRFTKKETKG